MGMTLSILRLSGNIPVLNVWLKMLGNGEIKLLLTSCFKSLVLIPSGPLLFLYSWSWSIYQWQIQELAKT